MSSISSISSVSGVARSQEASLNAASAGTAGAKSESVSGSSFSDRLSTSLKAVADAQVNAADLVKEYELGKEQNLTKVMVAQQVSSLSFDLTLNVRNKALSAYKDIMNMPV